MIQLLGKGGIYKMKNFFDENELEDVFAELNEEIDKHKNDKSDSDDEEMSASQRRYEEIIKKRKE